MTPPMFGDTRLTIPYFQQMTLRSKNGVKCELFWSGVSIILEQSVNYFDHFGGGMFFLKIGCAECNFTINSRC
jgi:hypothetical protein